ncbi:hypothetical protein GCM10011371_02050 [Novosphingobium marinum]|uniref:Uncharacterized protein n=1 Tax=Novosphingobium marinum TaxID=1514948 RepID=A0A7Y9XSX6_9SPHN|nr:hypothetical protein [Novosphingobium marinum]NYH93897.1 hypothetical protein [Novosphingobium marinum]GGC18107.1 hypothetical protein GCM10011371_02050 [Novosphingobium marinum]
MEMGPVEPVAEIVVPLWERPQQRPSLTVETVSIMSIFALSWLNLAHAIT